MHFYLLAVKELEKITQLFSLQKFWCILKKDEPRSVLFHYHESGSALEFMRIKVRSLHPDEGSAELDVLQVRGHWSAAH